MRLSDWTGEKSIYLLPKKKKKLKHKNIERLEVTGGTTKIHQANTSKIKVEWPYYLVPDKMIFKSKKERLGLRGWPQNGKTFTSPGWHNAKSTGTSSNNFTIYNAVLLPPLLVAGRNDLGCPGQPLDFVSPDCAKGPRNDKPSSSPWLWLILLPLRNRQLGVKAASPLAWEGRCVRMSPYFMGWGRNTQNKGAVPIGKAEILTSWSPIFL